MPLPHFGPLKTRGVWLRAHFAVLEAPPLNKNASLDDSGGEENGGLEMAEYLPASQLGSEEGAFSKFHCAV